MSMRTKLGEAKGLGSAKEGVGHWWMQRVSAIALVPLSLWFLYSVFLLLGADLAETRAYLSTHINTVLMSLFVIFLFYHLSLGVQVVIEDYIHGKFLRNVTLIGQKLIIFVLALSCLISILRIALSA